MVDCGIALTSLAEIVWQRTAALRREAHRHTGGERCPSAVAPYGPQDPSGQQVSEACLAVGCLDLVHDVVELVQVGLLRRRNSTEPERRPEDPLRYASSAVKRAVCDIQRRRRVARGLPAKPARPDGVPERVIGVLRDHSEGSCPPAWWIALFRMVRAYPCRPGPAGRSWPLDAWAEEKSRWDGEARVPGTVATRAEIAGDITWVLSVVDEVAGPGWRYENITLPLISGFDPMSADALPDWHPDHPLADPPDDQVQYRLFTGHYARLRGLGVPSVDAVRSAAAQVYGQEPTAPTHRIRALSQELETTMTSSGPSWLARRRSA